MRKIVRIVAGIALVGTVLRLADLSTRDCRIAPFVYSNCLWIGLRARWGLPDSRFLRMATLEGVGILLAAALYVALRYVLPWRRATAAPPEPVPPAAAEE
jgi:hypothetical protein